MGRKFHFFLFLVLTLSLLSLSVRAKNSPEMVSRMATTELFDTYWTDIFRLTLPWAESFFRIITELGSDYFYTMLIAIGFWTVDKRKSIKLTFVLVSSVVLNYWMKITFRNLRPPSANWLSGADVSNYSLPSGHAQNSVVLWGWLGIKIKKWWISFLFFGLILLIGLSRIYLGVHWLGDVLAGWMVGLILLSAIWRLEKPVESFLSRFNPNLSYLGLAIFGLVAMVLTELISPVTIIGLETNFGVNGGMMIGLGIGLLLERRYVNFEAPGSKKAKWRIILRVIIGLVLVFGFTLGLSPILLTEVYWLRAIRYALVTIIVTFVWPFLFEKLNL